MVAGALDHVNAYLCELIEERPVFEARFGKNAGVFLQHLPALYRLFHRLTFEFKLRPDQRQKSASVAVYIAEHQDFVGEASRGVEGLIDDVWIAFTWLAQLLQEVPEEVLAEHWRSEHDFEQVCALAPNVGSLDAMVPSRVLGLAQKFLDLDAESSAESPEADAK